MDQDVVNSIEDDGSSTKCRCLRVRVYGFEPRPECGDDL